MKQPVVIRTGDVLEYEVFLAPSCPSPSGGLDVQFRDNPCLCRAANRSLKDQNGVSVHGNGPLKEAIGAWYSRRIALDPVASWETEDWEFVFHGEEPGTYVQFLDNIAIAHADGTRTSVYEDGPPGDVDVLYSNGYSKTILIDAVPRARVQGGADVEEVVAPALRRQERLASLADLRGRVELLIALSARIPTAEEARRCLEETSATLHLLEAGIDLSASEVDERRNEVEAKLESTSFPFRSRYVGHLVGHAHIDAQWLWEWPETLEEFRKTFTQALAFMDEYPGFTFTQSSSMFYQATEYHWPDLFRRIRERVKGGQWEIVGGRMTEADNNILSSESHAREFLYGQRFFRERFDGRQAVVAWEPDTFGHNAQMPQIVRLGGCRYYYFCRAGKDHPLFWWQGLDGTRLLTFQEIHSWYNSDLTLHQFREMLDFEDRTGSPEMMWVYGVGNHGGGPTREYLQVATGWQKKPYLPEARYSTATEFFVNVEKTCDSARLPVVEGELNFVFEGCYTTHGDIKRWNNNCESLTESAEVIAAIASRYGYPYPGTQLRQNWEDLCWNHHHDTIDGSAVNAAYKKSKEVAERVLASSRSIANEAAAFLAAQVDAPEGDLVVFNPTGSPRDAEVEFTLPKGLRSGPAVAHDGIRTSPVQVLDQQSGRALFLARGLPPCGHRTYEFKPATGEPGTGATVSSDGRILENQRLRLELDPTSGTIRRLYDKLAERELVPAGGQMNRFEIHWEEPSGMPAWDIGRIERVEVLGSPIQLHVVESGPERVRVESVRRWRENTITQRIGLLANSDRVECELLVDWKETGEGNPAHWPFLRVAFDHALNQPEARFDIPFGSVSRPVDGHEVPAVHWVDLSESGYGFALLDDAKHGHSVSTGTLRLSLVRAPTYPDPTSDNYPQIIRYALCPHLGDWRGAAISARAAAWTHPVFTAPVPASSACRLPREWSFIHFSTSAAVLSAVKRAEDDNDLVVRFYEAHGTPVAVRLNTTWPVEQWTCTNFLEDPQPDGVQPGGGRSVNTQLRPFEIQTVKLRLHPVEGVHMSGTHGPGEPRPF